VNGPETREDRTILEALEALEGAGPLAGEPGAVARPAPSPSEAADAAETLARLYTEVLGLLPYELAPAAPRPEARRRLLRAISTAEAALPSAVAAPPAPAPASPRRPREEAGAAPLAAPAPIAPSAPIAPIAPIAPPPRPARRRSLWPLTVAAALMVALAGLSLWLYTGLVRQEAQIEALRREIEVFRSRAGEPGAAATEAALLRAQLAESREKLALVTSRAVEVSPLRPVGEPPVQPGASGILFVAADHQHWYLALEGLRPVPPGRVYKLWFVADAGTVDAGSFTARAGEPVELSSENMPAGTRSAVITLEDDPATEIPAGPEVLRAAAVYQIL
jgi:hypothetical protein